MNILIIIIFNIHITTETKLIINKCIIKDHIIFLLDSITSQNKAKHITFNLSCRLIFIFSTVNAFFLKMKKKCYLSFCFK